MRRLALLPCLLLCGAAAAQAPAERAYAVDSAASDFHWLVYKAGTLSRLGHNHVISVGDMTGRVSVNAADPARSTFSIEFPVAALVVDDPMLRNGLGTEFASVPTADDVEGTRRNMLGDRVLDAERFASVRVTGTGPLGPPGSQTLDVQVEILGRVIDLTVPTSVVINEDRVEARGEFELNHADLGMQPFSVMLGALQVAEKMSFSYRIEARAADSAR